MGAGNFLSGRRPHTFWKAKIIKGFDDGGTGFLSDPGVQSETKYSPVKRSTEPPATHLQPMRLGIGFVGSPAR